LVADLSTVRENVTVGDFTIVGRGVAIENYCKIGKKCKLETNVYVTAYSTIGDYCFLAPGALTSNDNYMGRTEKRFKEYGGVTVKKGGRIGVGAVILPNKIVEEDTVIVAGSVLTKNTEPKKYMQEFQQNILEMYLKRSCWRNNKQIDVLMGIRVDE